MTEQRRLELQKELDAAYASGDRARIEAIERTRDREVLECTAHTADRIKRVEQNVSETKEAVFKLRDTFNAVENKAKGAKVGMTWLVEMLRLIAACGGGALILQALNTGGAQ